MSQSRKRHFQELLFRKPVPVPIKIVTLVSVKHKYQVASFTYEMFFFTVSIHRYGGVGFVSVSILQVLLQSSVCP